MSRNQIIVFFCLARSITNTSALYIANFLTFKYCTFPDISSLKKTTGTLFDVNERPGTNDPYGSPSKIFDKNSIMPSLNPRGNSRIPTTVPRL